MRTATEWRVRRRIANLLNVLGQRNAELTTASGAREQPRHFAAAGLARCRALLEGMYLLSAPKGRPDTAGVLLRSLVETWAVSVFVLLKKRQAIFELAPGAEEGLRKVIWAFGGGATPGTDKWLARFHSLAQKTPFRHKKGRRKGQPRPLSIAEVFGQVETLAAASGDSGLARSVKHAHNRIWKAESYVSTHANLASIVIPYVDQNAEPWSVIDRPEGWMPPEDMLVTGGLLTGMLAGLVYEAFGYSREPLFQLVKGIRKDPAARP
jgi:hypothetical protein